MADDLKIVAGDKEVKYQSIVQQIVALISDEPDLTANLGNICAALKEQFDFLWVGFYIVKGQELVLGPFQGPVACTRIAKGSGVCGMAWESGTTQVIPDVAAFPGHIACSSLSRSEIVIPVTRDGKVVAVLDVDSDRIDNFDQTDSLYLQKIADIIQF